MSRIDNCGLHTHSKLTVAHATALPASVTHAVPVPKTSTVDLAKDRVCGMAVNKSTALKSERGDKTCYFCSACTFVAIAAGAAIVTWPPIPALPWITWGMWLFLLVARVQFIGGWSFYVGTWNALCSRSLNMDFLVARGTSFVYFYGVAVLFFPYVLPIKINAGDVNFEVSALIIAFVLLGNYMEDRIKKRSSAGVCRRLNLKLVIACVSRDCVEMELPIELVMFDEACIVRPGRKIPTDGMVIDDTSPVDESMLMGESCRSKSLPSPTSLAEQSTNPACCTAAKRASVPKRRWRRLSRWSRMHKLAPRRFNESRTRLPPISFPRWRWRYFSRSWAGGRSAASLGLLAFISVPIVSCPCTIDVAAPAALMVGGGKGADGGILIRGGEILDRAQRLTAVVFDKTGPLTRGEPEVTDIVAQAGKRDEDMLRLAAAVEAGSEHPLGEATVRAVIQRGITLPAIANFTAIPGHGFRGDADGMHVLLGNRRLFRAEGAETTLVENVLASLEE